MSPRNGVRRSGQSSDPGIGRQQYDLRLPVRIAQLRSLQQVIRTRSTPTTAHGERSSTWLSAIAGAAVLLLAYHLDRRAVQPGNMDCSPVQDTPVRLWLPGAACQLFKIVTAIAAFVAPAN